MFSLVDLGWMEWASSSSDMSPIGAPRCCSIGTNGTLPVDHTPTIKSVRAFKLQILFQSRVFKKVYLYLESQAPFIDIPSTILINENIISKSKI